MKFGPSGNSQSYAEEGHKGTLDAPKWVADKGLDLYEYSFGRGVRIGSSLAEEIGQNAKQNGIEISVHAPYYINFASQEDEKVNNSYGYVMQSLNALMNFGGERCVVHVGSAQKDDRTSAFERVKKSLFNLAEMIIDNELDEKVFVCLETMGKFNQIGTLDEIIELCNIAPFYLPCIDFGHLNSRNQGYLKSPDDYRVIFDKLYNKIGEEKAKKMHVHFSRIQYGAKGEIKHLTFADTQYGPFFEDMNPILHEFKSEAHIICESKGTQAEDAVIMKDIYNGYEK